MLAKTRAQVYGATLGPYYVLIGVGVAIAGLNIIASGNPAFSERVLASAIIAISFIPMLQFISEDDGGIPFLPLLGGVYAIHYALPVFLLDSFEFKEWVFPQSIREERKDIRQRLIRP